MGLLRGWHVLPSPTGTAPLAAVCLLAALRTPQVRSLLFIAWWSTSKRNRLLTPVTCAVQVKHSLYGGATPFSKLGCMEVHLAHKELLHPLLKFCGVELTPLLPLARPALVTSTLWVRIPLTPFVLLEAFSRAACLLRVSCSVSGAALTQFILQLHRSTFACAGSQSS